MSSSFFISKENGFLTNERGQLPELTQNAFLPHGMMDTAREICEEVAPQILLAGALYLGKRFHQNKLDTTLTSLIRPEPHLKGIRSTPQPARKALTQKKSNVNKKKQEVKDLQNRQLNLEIRQNKMALNILNQAKTKAISKNEIRAQMPRITKRNEKWMLENTKATHNQYNNYRKTAFFHNALKHTASFFITYLVFNHLHQDFVKKDEFNEILQVTSDNISNNRKNLNENVLSNYLTIKHDLVYDVEKKHKEPFNAKHQEINEKIESEIKKTENLIIETKSKLNSKNIGDSKTNEYEQEIMNLEAKLAAFKTELSNTQAAIDATKHEIDDGVKTMESFMEKQLQAVLLNVNDIELGKEVNQNYLTQAKEVALHTAPLLVGLFMAVASRKMSTAKFFLENIKLNKIPEKAKNYIVHATSVITAMALQESLKNVVDPFVTKGQVRGEVSHLLAQYGITPEAHEPKINRNMADFATGVLSGLMSNFIKAPFQSEMGGILLNTLLQTKTNPLADRHATSQFTSEYIEQGLEPLNREIHEMEVKIQSLIEQTKDNKAEFLNAVQDRHQHELSHLNETLERINEIKSEVIYAQKEINLAQGSLFTRSYSWILSGDNQRSRLI